jgi:hypothetical protein
MREVKLDGSAVGSAGRAETSTVVSEATLMPLGPEGSRAGLVANCLFLVQRCAPQCAFAVSRNRRSLTLELSVYYNRLNS